MGSTSILIYGFAIFAMFFGSGNLVFPLQIGASSGSHWLIGFFGLFLTGIALPFLGLFVIKLHKGNYYRFFNGAGKLAKIALPLFTLSLLGSFGVVPRCIAVAHGGLSYIFPEISLLPFSILFCAITFYFCLKDQRMITILGKWMSPVLLVSLIALIIFGIIQSDSPKAVTSSNTAFFNGFMTGYQTMDLFAAFFFSALIFKQISARLPKDTCDKQILKFAVLPSIIGSLMLAFIYLGFVYLGSHHPLATIAPELMLPAIANEVMGPSATLVIAIAMIFSCLTTAVALNNIYARYLCDALSLGENRFTYILIATTACAFIISLLNFKGIAAFIAPALELSYPGLIALTIASIFLPYARRIKIILFWSITLATIGYSFF